MNPDVRNVVEGNTRFALDLYARLRREQDGNLFFAPGSLSTALAMTYAGAEGQTAEQMAEVLHFRLPQETLHPAFASLQQTWNADGKEAGYHLSVANRLWVQKDFDIGERFLTTTRESYGAEVAQVDFIREAEQAAQQINAWVAEQTEGKIADLIPPGVLDETTRLALTNAIAFKGDWAETFRKGSTNDAPFHLTADRQVEVPLMFRRDDYGYGDGDGLKVLSLPYRGDKLSMVVLLPDEVEGLNDLEARLNPDTLSGWVSGLREQEVDVYLPRFKLSSQIQLAEMLEAMGMPSAFIPSQADFSGLSGEEGLFLSAVIHKAFVDVNEEGTEAVAAMEFVVSTDEFGVEPPEPPKFRADHPFVFLIRDNRTGSILFLGRLVDPSG